MVVGAIGAAIVGALGRPSDTAAADGSPVIAGQSNATSQPTSVAMDNAGVFATLAVYGNGGAALVGSSGPGIGVSGQSGGNDGVYGSSDTGTGVEGRSNSGIGVHGRSESARMVGVLGETAHRESAAVEGRNLATATQGRLATPTNGVVGIAPEGPGFVGVRAVALTPATALAVDGRAAFSRSGTAVVPKGRSYVDVVVPDGLSPTSFVLATPMTNRAGVYVQSAVPNRATGKVRINLNKVASASSTTPIGWLVVN